ncbi:MAG TPA: DUF3311 domain-containing protein [Rugosimonospora sp.]|nr:DUF3311 domain-containing protein [Rugosimonospora sp.]
MDATDRPDARGWYWLLWVPIGLASLVPMFNRLTPALFGIPFFYWWQMGLAALSTLTLSVVHLATKKERV